MSTTVTVYGRPDCHLCDEAMATIARIAEEKGGFSVETIDIESDDALFLTYLERIPVVVIQGESVSELVFDESAFRARIDTLD